MNDRPEINQEEYRAVCSALGAVANDYLQATPPAQIKVFTLLNALAHIAAFTIASTDDQQAEDWFHYAIDQALEDIEMQHK